MNEATLPRADRTLIQAEPGFGTLMLVLLGVLAVRVIGLAVSGAELFYDEAQYWIWGRELAFGYYGKPPLLAWIVGATTAVCGDSPFCVRLPSPVIHFGTALVIYALALRLFDRRVAFWSSVFFATLPGTSVSAIVMSTDVPLLFFWSLALLALIRHIERPSIGAGLLLGMAIGLGLNSKYAMFYFALCLAVHVVLAKEARVVLRHPGTWLAIVAAALLFVPNVLWNADHAYATFAGSGAGGLTPRSPDILALLEFVAVQAVIVGPVVFAGYCMAVAGRVPGPNRAAHRLLLCYSLPIFAVVALQALIARAHGDWAVAAFPAAVIAATAAMLFLHWNRGLVATIAVGATVLAFLSFSGSFTGIITSGPVGAELAKLVGWGEFSDDVRRVAGSTGVRRVVFIGRGMTASMIYELRDSDVEIRSYTPDPEAPRDHYQLTRPWSPGDPGPVLLFTIGEAGVPEELAGRVTRVETFQTRIHLARNRNWFATAWRVN